MLREIANSQNAQITFMRGYLSENGYAEVGDACENNEGDDEVPGWAIGVIAVLGALCLALIATIMLKRFSPAARAANVGGAKM